MVGEGGSCEKDLRLVGREFQRRGEELRKEQSDKLNSNVRCGKKRQRWSDEPSVTSGFHIDEITQIVWFRFMEEIIIDMIFVLYTLQRRS